MGNVHHRDTNDKDDEFKRTYASEPTLPEKYSNSKQRTIAKVSTTTFWIVSLIIAVVSFTSYKTASEIIRRIITDCGMPTIEHGYLEKDGTLFMSQATVKCDTGYKPSQPKVTCTASGTWQQAECFNVDDCANNPCLNEGQCEDKVADYVCKCQHWYSGKNCEISEACVNHKCQCGGRCVPLPNGSYNCACPPHIHGIFCERPHDGFLCN